MFVFGPMEQNVCGGSRREETDSSPSPRGHRGDLALGKWSVPLLHCLPSKGHM